MNEFSYFKMLIEGLQENQKFLPQYLTREQKKAEKGFIEFDEFIGRTISLIEAIESDIRLLYRDEPKDVEIRKEITLWNYTVKLSKLTNGQFEGDIGFKETSLLRQAINDAFEFSRQEDDPYEFVQYVGAKKPDSNVDKEIDSIDNNDTSNNEHSQIFRGNGYSIWQRYFEHAEVGESSRTDLRFAYEIMKHHDLIYPTVTVTNITDWINETYGFCIDKLQYTNIKLNSNKKRRKDYYLLIEAMKG